MKLTEYFCSGGYKMKKINKLLLALALISSPFFNSYCFGKTADKVTANNNSKKINAKSEKKSIQPQAQPIEYKTQKLSENKTKVSIIMHIPNQKGKKPDMEKVDICDPKGRKILRMHKKVSNVTIGGKAYIKIEFSYIVEIRDKTEKDFVWPVPGFSIITSDFDDKENRKRPHGAIDIAGEKIYGADVVASNSGKVTTANKEGWGGGYGKYVVIDHGDGKTTLYAHMSDVAVEVGDEVSTGQKIGEVGNTGFTTGPHLHFEYRINGVRTDPAEILDI